MSAPPGINEGQSTARPPMFNRKHYSWKKVLQLVEEFRMMEKNTKAKKILICGLGLDEYNRISACSNTKEIWDALQAAHEGTNQVKRSRIELLMRNYEFFSCLVVCSS
ncbi:uncharacterized protein [Nicotiana tomentosiformis]|uniref:uncharacterized protein n=1 Tax=Nicotiana tomentosiformis TaxID=4098 RepID=UPI00388C70E6